MAPYLPRAIGMSMCVRTVVLLFAISVWPSSAAVADLVTFDFRQGGTPGIEVDPGVGNQWVFNSGGVTLTVTAWSLMGPTPGAFQPARLLVSPLGICNTDEDCRTTEHSVDNLGQGDFVLFQFSQSVIPLSAGVRPRLSNSDSDVSFFLSHTAPPLLDLTGRTLATLGNGFSSAFHDDTATLGVPRAVSLWGGPATSVLFGARVGGDNADDFFKVVSIAVETYSVPEPGTLSLLLLPSAGLLYRRARRR